jgi:hypothetical protein
MDRSREDFSVAKSLLSYDRMTEQEVMTVLLYGSSKARERGEAYVTAVVESVRFASRRTADAERQQPDIHDSAVPDRSVWRR